MGEDLKTRPFARSRCSRLVRPLLAIVGLSLSLLTEPLALASSGSWTTTADMLFDTWNHAATLLADGRVLVVGGLDFADPNLTISVTYDPGSQTWTRQGDLTKRRNSSLTATQLPDGRVLVVGGDASDRYQTSEVFDPASGTWTLSGDLNVPRSNARAVALADGRVLLAGGFRVGGGADPARDVEIYDPANGMWAITGSLVLPRAANSFGIIALQDGRVLVVGGDQINATWELYDPALGAWTLAGAIGARLSYDPLTVLPDGRVLSVHFWLRNAFLYDPASNTWTETTGPQFRHDWGTATLLPDGTVLVTASVSALGAEVFDPAAGTWQSTGPMLQRPREHHTATLLPDGTVLVAGGAYEGPPCDEGTCTVTTLKSAEIFTPGAGI